MNPLGKMMAELWKDFIDLIFPGCCQLCGKNDEKIICDDCSSMLTKLPSGYSPDYSIDASLEYIRPLAPFDSPHRELIHLLKYSGIVAIADFFGHRIGKLIVEDKYFVDFDVLIPVPLHKKRRRQRRFNQAEIIANAAADVCKIPVKADIIERTRYTESQTKLKPDERRINVQGAFNVKASDSIIGRSAIIVDDVVTTGATTEEIARQLKKAGAKRTAAVCIAHPEQRQSNRYRI